MEQLSEQNFLVYAMHNFEVPTCLDLEEFNSEIKRFRYISRAFKSDNVNTQLVLNHIIILHNVFGSAATKMLMFKVEKDQWPKLVPFLLYLDRLSIQDITEIANELVIDELIAAELRNL